MIHPLPRTIWGFCVLFCFRASLLPNQELEEKGDDHTKASRVPEFSEINSQVLWGPCPGSCTKCWRLESPSLGYG